jgi:hypothetical protein
MSWTYNVIMIETLWANLSETMDVVDVSKPTIVRRALCFRKLPEDIDLYTCPEGKVRFIKVHKSGKKKRPEVQYYIPDVLRWLT